MDEVDGMSGGDRGGVQDLIESIKRSRVPIIAICNDKYHQKLRSLRNHCLELEYRCACVPSSFCCIAATSAPTADMDSCSARSCHNLSAVRGLRVEHTRRQHAYWRCLQIDAAMIAYAMTLLPKRT